MATHRNDPALVRDLLTTPATWAVVGLGANPDRTAYRISRFLLDEVGMDVIPVHPRGETVHERQGYRSLAEVPDGERVRVVDCFVASARVGAVVDDAIAHKERLSIRAVWLQLGVVDEAAAERAQSAGLGVVMDTCPAIEWPRLTESGD